MHPQHSSTSTVEPHTTQYTQNSSGHYCQTVDSTWVNSTLRQAILSEANTNHHIAFSKVNFQTSNASFHCMDLLLSPSSVSLIRTRSSAYSNPLNTPANSVTTSTTAAQRRGHRTLMYPHCNLKLISQLRIHSDSSLCSLIHTHH